MGDQSDAKVLLGTYVCTETPGEFKWQPGALTQAVKEGKWIIIEDIDLASVDVISVILPLLETRKLFIPGRGEEIQAAHGFQIFATETLLGSEGFQSSRGRASGKLLSKFWTKIVVNPLPETEIITVLQQSFSNLSMIIDKFINTFNLLKNQANQQMYGSARPLSFRDLMKWCNRVSRFCNESQLIITNAESAQLKEIIFSEAYDCFCAMLANPQHRLDMMKQIAFAWGILPDHVHFFIEKYKPSLQLTKSTFSIGRQTIQRVKSDESSSKSNFALTMHALRNIERISVCIQLSEPILLVGETGTGKTSILQYIANQIGKKLIVQNLSQQSDSTDLLGGFKPIELRSLCVPLKNEFDYLFPKTFSRKNNQTFLDKINLCYASQNWDTFIKLLHDVIKKVDIVHPNSSDAADEKSKKVKKTKLKQNIRNRWKILNSSVTKFIEQRKKISSNFAFAFVEGALVKAVRNGDWVLLDEINLASTETLESLSGLLEGGGLYLTERGDISAVERHPQFRIFACMNPATDIGKKDLPPGLRNRFTEFYVDELNNEIDLKTVVLSYLQPIMVKPPVDSIVQFYLSAKKEANINLSDGANHKPHYSLRSLCRALQYTRDVVSQFGFYRSLYEGICASFLTQLNSKSIPIMERLIHKFIVAELTKNKQSLKTMPKQPSPKHVKFSQFWIEIGGNGDKVEIPANYILTKSIKNHLTSLARIVLTRKYPVLLQGPTSSGKTSMVQYLAQSTGHRFVRINNHEHTDIQEYLGCYVSDTNGNLIFQEGILVEAVRNGYWVVLDELNLAPSEVLEALNRLLDDNRELFIPETQEVIKPHPHFMLFATQNPPGAYGGRKVLSRAFRNRFLELHFDDIPDDELQTILEKRCEIAPSYCAKLVSVMKDLQRQRHGTKVFAGKNSLITLRDLFRWANRKANGYQELAIDGYMLLAERLRNEDEKKFIQEILEKHMKIKFNMNEIYGNNNTTTTTVNNNKNVTEHIHHSLNQLYEIQNLLDSSESLKNEFNIVWTTSMKRMFMLLSRCIENQEPVLLIGETGCGKTTVCQLFSILLKRNIQILNCHQHTETADFLGSLRPIRGKEAITELLQNKLYSFFELLENEKIIEGFDQSSLMRLKNSTLTQLLSNYDTIKSNYFHSSSSSQIEISNQNIHDIFNEINSLSMQYKSLFEWQDGPLVTSMKNGDLFLIDEISLAEDSVLERLNSVLEPDRSLVLAEKGASEIESLIANDNFRVFATMNPGGDFGKRELSPALRNRFTEIWVPSITAREELIQILKERLHKEICFFANLIIDFVEWFKETLRGKRLISLRDLLAWIQFMNIMNTKQQNNTYKSYEMYLHGACLVLLDGLPVSTGYSERKCKTIRKNSFEFILNQFKKSNISIPPLKNSIDFEIHFPENIIKENSFFGIDPFYISIGNYTIPDDLNFSLKAPTTCNNLMRILRSMQIKKPILLEGSPGVGKTSLITAMANASGHKIIRINLSEQTDMMDLLGTDLPVEGGKPGEFGWSDGVFLRALKDGDWVLLDELNLASQSVLEGLNSCLDHRGSVYIPEIGKEFKCPSTFRIFACQNPTQQGGGRKGLPKSFLNRFTQVYIEQFESEDLLFISSAMYPELPIELLEKMIEFNTKMYNDSMIHSKFGRKGSPWEFNLRDIFRWCTLIQKYTPKLILQQKQFNSMTKQASRFIDLIYCQRMRTQIDRNYIINIFNEIFGFSLQKFTDISYPKFKLTSKNLQIGFSNLTVNQRSIIIKQQLNLGLELQILPCQLNILENIMKCIEMNWMVILLGSSGSGKTSIIQLLSTLVGKNLYQFWMNSSVDTTELLGGFEQIDLVRKKKNLLFELSKLIDEITEQVMLFNVTNQSSQNNLICDLHNQWNSFYNHCKKSSLDQNINFTSNQFNFLNNFLMQLTKYEKFCLSPGSIDFFRLTITKLTSQVNHLQKIEIHSVTGCFEWIDGILLQALENGDWILIDNVNFCNPSVLDRLNPLLESNGSLMVNERGVIDGEVKIIKPHPNFRIFVTMDPENGEISRAMRNRGIEINLISSVQLSNDENGFILLNNIGIPGSFIPKQMILFHQQILKMQQIAKDNHQFGIRDLLRWSSLTVSLLQRGFYFKSAITMSMKQVYQRNQRLSSTKQQIQNHFDEIIIESLFSLDNHSNKMILSSESSFRSSNLCPSLLRGNHIYNLSTLENFNIASFSYYIISEQISQTIDQFIIDIQQYKKLDISNVFSELFKLNIPFIYWSTNILQYLFTYFENKQQKNNLFEPTKYKGKTWKEIKKFQCNSSSKLSSFDFNTLIYSIGLHTIVERSPIESYSNTIQWVKNFLLPLENSIQSMKNENNYFSSTFITQIFSHPILNRIKNQSSSIFKFIQYDGDLNHEIDIRTNSSLYQYILWHIDSLQSNEFEKLWKSLLNSSFSFEFYVKRFIRNQIENIEYLKTTKVSSSLSSVSDLSIIQLSYLYDKKLLQNDYFNNNNCLFNDFIPIVFSFFNSFDEFIIQLLCSENEILLFNENQWNEIHLLMFFRDSVWDSLHINPLHNEKFIGNWNSFLSKWNKFSELLLRDLSNHNQIKGLIDSISSSIDNIRSICLQMKLYWTLSGLLIHGAKQKVLKEKQVISVYFNILKEIQLFEDFIHNQLSLSQQMDIKMNSNFNEKMQLAGDALCTLQWIDNHFEKGKSLISTLSSIPSILQSELQAYQKKIKEENLEKQKQNEKQFISDQEEIQKEKYDIIKEELLWLEYSSNILIPLRDHLSLLYESNHISKLSELLFTQLQYERESFQTISSPENSLHGKMEILEFFTKLKEFLQLHKLTSRPPTDIVPYKHLIWASEDNNQSSESKSPLESEKINIQSAISKLSGFYQEILFQYQSRLWKNSFSKPISLILSSSQDKNSNHSILSSESKFLKLFNTIESGSYRQHIGSSQLYQSIHSYLAFHLNSSLPLLPLQYRDEKLKQLEKLQNHFDIHYFSDINDKEVIQKEWFFLLHTFLYIIHCQFMESKQNTENNNLLNKLQIIWSNLIEKLSKTNDNNDNNDILQSLIHLKDLIHNFIDDSIFISIRNELITPILELFSDFFTNSSFFDSEMNELQSRCKLWVLIGVLQFILLVPNTNIDPTSKYIVKLKSYEDLYNKLSIELETRKYIENKQTGNTNIIINQIQSKLNKIKEKIVKLKDKITIRPETPLFRNLYDEIKQFQTHLLSIEKVKELLKNLLLFQGIEREAMWQDRTMEFISILSSKYISFNDITLPIINSIYQIKYGFRLLSSTIASIQNSLHCKLNHMNSSTFLSNKEEFEKIIILLIQLPSITVELYKNPNHSNEEKEKKLNYHVDVLEKLLSPHSIHIIDQFLNENDANECYSFYLRCLLSNIYNIVIVMHGYLPPKIISILQRLYAIFTSTWNKMKEDERKRKEEEESLYKYKEKSHDEGETEEEEDERHLRELFPDFSDHFNDLDTNDYDDDIDDNNENANNTIKEKVLEASPTLGDNECWFLYEAHQRIFAYSAFEQKNQHQVNLNNEKIKFSLDIEKLNEYQKKEFLLSYETSNKLFNQIINKIPSSTIDKQTTTSHTVASYLMKKILSTSPIESFNMINENHDKPQTNYISPFEYFNSCRIYNIHTDPNISESQLLQKPLHTFKLTIQNLLEQWPENPVLQNLIKIIDRLLSFPIYSPLVKFITGLELLLRKANEWEKFAHSKISLKDHLDEIATLIGRWRKIELRSWPDILATRVKNFETKAIRWWFDLYQSVILSIDAALDISIDDQQEYLDKLLQTLTDFAQSSNMGEFSIRMKLLNSFANQLSYSINDHILIKKVYFILKNLHEYYMQYWNSYIDYVESQKLPIQKDIQNFIKLAKWEKLEYFLLQDIADRSHKKLCKFAKNFEKILRTPISILFSSTEENYSPLQYLQIVPKDYVLTKILPTKLKRSLKMKERREAKRQKKLEKQKQKQNCLQKLSTTNNNDIIMEDILCKIPKNLLQSVYIYNYPSGQNKKQKKKNVDQIQFQHERFPSLYKKLLSMSYSNFIDNDIYQKRIDYLLLPNELSISLIDTTKQFQQPEKTQTQKQLAVTSYIRSLRSMGISFHKKDLHPKQNDISELLQLPSISLNDLFDFKLPIHQKTSDPLSMDESNLYKYFDNNHQSFTDIWISSSKYFYKNLTRLRKIRELVTNPPSRDLTNRQILILSGYIEHMFTLGLEQRDFFYDNYLSLCKFKKFSLFFENSLENPLENYSNLRDCHENVFPSQKIAKNLLDFQDQITNEISLTLGKISLIFESSSQVKNENYNQMIQNHQKTILSIQENSNEIYSLNHYKEKDNQNNFPYLISRKQFQLLETQQKQITNIINEIKNSIQNDDNNSSTSPSSSNFYLILNSLYSIQNHFHTHKNLIHEKNKKFVNLNQNIDSDISSNEMKENINNFFNSLDFGTKHILIAIQRLLPILSSFDENLQSFKPKQQEAEAEEENKEEEGEQEQTNDDNDEEEKPISIPKIQNDLFNCFKSLKLNELNEKLSNIFHDMEKLCNSCNRENLIDLDILCSCQGFLHQFSILFHQFDKMMKFLFVYLLIWHKGCMKLCYIGSGIFSTLLYQGFCKPSDADDDDNAPTEDASGTGLGSGEGQNDISDQIDDEEQLQKQEQDENPNQQMEEQEKAIETEQDFESDLQDVKPDDNNQDDNQNDEEDSEEEEDNFDDEMGEVDRDQEEILDEKLWNEEDEDENLDEREGEGSDVKSDQIQDELMANEKDDQKDQNNQSDDDDDQEPEKPELSDNEDLDNDNDDSSEDSDQMDGDMVDIQDDEDRNQFNELNAEQDFELPEEMNVDEDDLHDDDENNEDQDQDGENNNDDDDDVMNDEDDNMSDVEDENEKESDQIDNENDEKDEENEANPEDGKAMENIDEENKEEGDEDENNEENSLNKDSYQNEYDEETLEQQIGIRDDKGNDANVEQNQQNSLDDETQQDQMEDEETFSDTTQQSKDSQGTWTENRNQQNKDQQQQDQPKQENPQFDPNPYRSLGDASKKWEEKVKMIQDAPLSLENDKNENQQKELDHDKQNANDFEFINEENNQDDEQQTLAPATEEQSNEISVQPEDKEEEDENKEEDDQLNKKDENLDEDKKEDEKLDDENKNEKNSKENSKISSRIIQNKPDDDDNDDNDDNDMDIDEDEKKNDENEEEIEGTEFDPTRHDKVHFDLSKFEENEEEKLEEEEQKNLTPLEIQNKRKLLEEYLAQWRNNIDEIEKAQELWSKYEELTQIPSQELCEQLRLILEPTLATKLRGDYRSGKRINMKKVIPYIASQFRKDKIWLRRTKPNKRHYQVLVAIDDSESMSLNNAGPLACEAMTMIARSLTQLEVGELAILKFGETIDLVHPFDQPFTDTIGPQVISRFLFNQKGTNVLQLLNTTVNLLDNARLSSNTQSEHVQLVFIISDGRLSTKAGLGQWIRDAEKKRVLIVFIIIDSPNSKDSILQLEVCIINNI